jgi:hypothetical protein
MGKASYQQAPKSLPQDADSYLTNIEIGQTLTDFFATLCPLAFVSSLPSTPTSSHNYQSVMVSLKPKDAHDLASSSSNTRMQAPNTKCSVFTSSAATLQC